MPTQTEFDRLDPDGRVADDADEIEGLGGARRRRVARRRDRRPGRGRRGGSVVGPADRSAGRRHSLVGGSGRRGGGRRLGPRRGDYDDRRRAPVRGGRRGQGADPRGVAGRQLDLRLADTLVIGVVGSTAVIRGVVDDLDDGDSIVDVVGRVDGIAEVRDETVVRGPLTVQVRHGASWVEDPGDRRASAASVGSVFRWRPASRCPARRGTTCAGAWRSDVARASSSIAASRGRARRRGAPRPRGSRSRRRPAAPGSNRSRRARASSMSPASNWARARFAIRARGRAGRRQAEPGHRARRSRAAAAAERRHGARRSRARARPGAGCAGRAARPARREASSRRERRQAVGASAPRCRRARRHRRQRRGIEAARDGPQIEAGPAGQDRDAAARARSAQTPGRGDEVGDRERLVRLDEVEAVMRDARRSAGVGFAVPMSRPRKTCRESAEMTPRAGLARGAPRDLDREAGLAGRRRPGDDEERAGASGQARRRSPQRVRAGVLDPDRRVVPDQPASPARWTSLFPRVRPERRTGAPRRRARRRRSCSCSWAAERRRRGPRPRDQARPGSARGRSAPGGRAARSAGALVVGRDVVGEAASRASRAAPRRPRRRPGRSGRSRAARASPRTGPRSRRRTRR